MRIEARKLVQQADAVFVAFPHTENPAAANGDAGLAHVSDGLQAVFVDVGGD